MQRRYKVSAFTVVEDTEEGEADIGFIKECITEAFGDNYINVEGELEVVEIKDAT